MEQKPKPKLTAENHMMLFVRIDQINDEWIPKKKEYWRKYHFSHVENRFTSSTHFWSPDKNEFKHAYRDLSSDEYYIILALRIPGLVDTLNGETIHRWLWQCAVPVSEPIIKKAWKFYKKTGDAKATALYVDELLYPKLSPSLDEFQFV